jgi:hypothetical protein
MQDEPPPYRRPAMDEIDAALGTDENTLRAPRENRRRRQRYDEGIDSNDYDDNSPSDDPRVRMKVVNHQIKIQEEHWIKSYWRPAMGWLYMLICFVDFVVFPALTMFLPAMLKGFGVTIDYSAWESLTLTNGGLIHIAFGAILGVAAWSRGKEKINGRN